MPNFDIERFPNSECAKRMISRVSPVYDKAYVAKWLFEVIGIELDKANHLVESLADQNILELATWGLCYWEQRYGIPVNEFEDVEVRRAEVQEKRKIYGSFTPARLESIIKAKTGRESLVIERNSTYCFEIEINEGTHIADYRKLIALINSMKPSHLTYSIKLPRDGSVDICIGTMLDETKTIVCSECDYSGVSETVTRLVDENLCYLVTESEQYLVD